MSQLSKRNVPLIIAMLATIVLGIGIRKLGHGLPPLLYKAVPDALWATMVALLFAILLPKQPTQKLALYALLFSVGIEFSQLYQADWINGLRRTTLGALVLGSGFAWLDMLYYLFGIVAFWLLHQKLIPQEGIEASPTETAQHQREL